MRAGLRPLPGALLAAALIASALAVAQPAGAIVDGRRVGPGERPWQVALAYLDGEPFCGGTLASPDVVITAAHCTEDLRRDDFVVVAGAVDLDRDRGQERDVDAVIPHPRYANDELADIAVVRLDAPVEVDRTVRPVPLARGRDVARADTGVISGWGARHERDERLITSLRTTWVPLWGDRSCGWDLDLDPRTELCAGGTGPDSCYGDSGGPLVVKGGRGQRMLAGVVSWGDRCGGRLPGAYADVAALTPWLRRAGVPEWSEVVGSVVSSWFRAGPS
jgi:secreted trypsin-like serine protease